MSAMVTHVLVNKPLIIKDINQTRLHKWNKITLHINLQSFCPAKHLNFGSNRVKISFYFNFIPHKLKFIHIDEIKPTLTKVCCTAN